MMRFWDGSGISCTIYRQSVPHSRQITTVAPRHSVWLDALPGAQPTVSELTQVVL